VIGAALVESAVPVMEACEEVPSVIETVEGPDSVKSGGPVKVTGQVAADQPAAVAVAVTVPDPGETELIVTEQEPLGPVTQEEADREPILVERET
jgi:hypothetical protein